MAIHHFYRLLDLTFVPDKTNGGLKSNGASSNVLFCGTLSLNVPRLDKVEQASAGPDIGEQTGPAEQDRGGDGPPGQG